MKFNKNIFQKIFYIGLIGVGALGITIYGSDYIVKRAATGKVFNKIIELPNNDVALVLGTKRLLSANYINNYYQYRINAAADLYLQGKVKHLLLSGDNSRKNYDEPSDMKADLIKLGVPENAITLDYAGFRTLDSVVRCKEIFGQEKFTIVSQPFHNERALFLAQQYDLDVVAYNAKTPFLKKRMIIREYLARVKAVLDVFILRKEPKFLGKKEEILVGN